MRVSPFYTSYRSYKRLVELENHCYAQDIHERKQGSVLFHGLFVCLFFLFSWKEPLGQAVAMSLFATIF